MKNITSEEGRPKGAEIIMKEIKKNEFFVVYFCDLKM